MIQKNRGFFSWLDDKYKVHAMNSKFRWKSLKEAKHKVSCIDELLNLRTPSRISRNLLTQNRGSWAANSKVVERNTHFFDFSSSLKAESSLKLLEAKLATMFTFFTVEDL
jgi:hypothetical protein